MNINDLTDTELLRIAFDPKEDRAQAALAVIYRRQLVNQGQQAHCEHDSCGATNAVLYLQQLADPQQMMNIAFGGYDDVTNDDFKIKPIKLQDNDPFGGSFKN